MFSFVVLALYFLWSVTSGLRSPSPLAWAVVQWMLRWWRSTACGPSPCTHTLPPNKMLDERNRTQLS